MEGANKKKQLYELLITMILWGVALTSFSYGYMWLAFSIVYFGNILSIFSEWQGIKNILRKYFLKFYQLIILSVSYIISVKYLNYRFDIENDYLTHSPWIVSIIFSAVLLFILLGVWVVISFLIHLLIAILSDFLPKNWIDKINNTKVMKLSNKSMNILLIVLPFYFLFAYIGEPLIKVALRMDAYAASDCGETKPNTAYLRKNDKECYVFSPWLSLEEPSVKPSIKGK
ncbi:hypothetical protein KKI90_23300 [Xenorhabdus bovienii]|uniref:hypothetical protein n=1 Tax=Xenorhabdus bovienii TaxID=40576 RepID=UPI00237C7015|nr:hypothetical protein [Xenorhabdus bovienii]MDE1489122.1 hypothetical protein [Xenorhabdus bovienii]MDE9480034.1 hypothetical protein [Xenorhabdus bovienii]MDE9532975.1 hypothetical protein [Xenorhabdus bovienii]